MAADWYGGPTAFRPSGIGRVQESFSAILRRDAGLQCTMRMPTPQDHLVLTEALGSCANHSSTYTQLCMLGLDSVTVDTDNLPLGAL